MAATVRYMQEEYFPRQAAALTRFTGRTGIAVIADFLPVDAFWHDAQAAFGPDPTWDLLVPDEVIVAEQIQKGRLEPLGERARIAGIDLGDWFPAGIDRFTSEGEVFGIPYVAMSNVLIYRKDLLNRLGIDVPRTWDDLRIAAIDAQRGARMLGFEDIAGFTSRGLAGYGHNFWILGSTIFPSWGWEWNRGPGAPPLIAQKETADALAYYAALLKDAGPRNSERLTFTDTHRLYSKGRAVFLLDAATELATMRREGPESAGHASDAAVVPVGPTGRPEPGLYSPAYCIPKSSDRKDEAFGLLTLLVSPDEVQKDTIEGGYAEPARMSIVSADDYEVSFAADFRETLRETREFARINRPMIQNGFAFGEIVGRAAEEVIAGSRTATAALNAAQKNLDAMSWSG